MAEAILEKEVCKKCGAEIRPDTQFCYNCGKQLEGTIPVIDEMPPPIKKPDVFEDEKSESLADLEKALSASRVAVDDPRSKIDAAARERRKARNAQRKPIEIVWEAGRQETNWVYLVTVCVIFFLVLLTVVLTVLWK